MEFQLKYFKKYNYDDIPIIKITGTIGFLTSLLFVRKLYSKAMLVKTSPIGTTIVRDTPGHVQISEM